MKKILTALFLSSLGVAYGMEKNQEETLDIKVYYGQLAQGLLGRKDQKVKDLKGEIENCKAWIRDAKRNGGNAPGSLDGYGLHVYAIYPGEPVVRIEGAMEDYRKELDDYLKTTEKKLERYLAISSGEREPGEEEINEFNAYLTKIQNEQAEREDAKAREDEKKLMIAFQDAIQKLNWGSFLNMAKEVSQKIKNGDSKGALNFFFETCGKPELKKPMDSFKIDEKALAALLGRSIGDEFEARKAKKNEAKQKQVADDLKILQGVLLGNGVLSKGAFWEAQSLEAKKLASALSSEEYSKKLDEIYSQDYITWVLDNPLTSLNQISPNTSFCFREVFKTAKGTNYSVLGLLGMVKEKALNS